MGAVPAPVGAASSALPPRLARLAERLRANEDFPAMSAQMVRVMQLAEHEHGSLRQLTEEILKDVALTNKLLRVVNAARFAGHQDGVGTVSRAISLLGVSAVRQLALSLVLLEHLEDRQQARGVREVYLRTLMAAHVAVALSAGKVDGEMAFLATLFQFLGPMVVLCHFPEVAQSLGAGARLDTAGLQAATMKALGVGLDELGQLVAAMWSLPEGIRRAMQRPDGVPPARLPQDPTDRLRWLARGSTDLADILLDAPEGLRVPETVRLVRALLPVLAQAEDVAQTQLQTAREQWWQSVSALGLDAEVRQRWGSSVAVGGDAAGEPSDGVAVQAVAVVPEDVLAQGLDDITAAMLEGVDPRERARMALEVICRALGLDRAVACRGVGGVLRGWVALGLPDGSRDRLQVSAAGGDDILSKLMATRKDTWVPDVQRAGWVARLPAWLPPPATGALLMMPLYRGQEVVGLVYADGGGRPHEAEMPGRALLQSLRRLLVMCLLQAKA